jgi:RimJ/RimL family protein N-acetyltransferase
MTVLSEAEIILLSQLKISEWQEIKGGSFLESLEAWREGPSSHVLGLCFLLQDQPIGMTLFKRPPLSPSWASTDAATIHGLKISPPFQGRGLGHIAFKLAVQQLKEQWHETSTLMLAVDADNTAAIAVYRAFGMEDSGPVFEGRNGLEKRFSISIK